MKSNLHANFHREIVTSQVVLDHLDARMTPNDANKLSRGKISHWRGRLEKAE